MKHVRRPLSALSRSQDEKDAKAKEEALDDLYENKDDDGIEKKPKENKNRQKDELRKSGKLIIVPSFTQTLTCIVSIDERWTEAFDAKISLLVNKDTIAVREYGGIRPEE